VPHPAWGHLHLHLRRRPPGHLHVPRPLRDAAVGGPERHDRRRDEAREQGRRAVQVRRRARRFAQRLVAQKSTYEQSAGLAAVPIGWVGGAQAGSPNARPGSPLVRATSRTRSAPRRCSPSCRFRIASITSLSALNIEIEVRTLRTQSHLKSCFSTRIS
jgi:hypothetical protein